METKNATHELAHSIIDKGCELANLPMVTLRDMYRTREQEHPPMAWTRGQLIGSLLRGIFEADIYSPEERVPD